MARRQQADGKGEAGTTTSGTRRRIPGVLTLVVTAAGLILLHNGLTKHSAPPQPPASVTGPLGSAAAPVAGPAVPAPAFPLSASDPTRILIPGLHVNAPFTTVGLTSGGNLGTPPDDEANLAGWYTGSVTPGQAGTAVVVGHVDTYSGPAVFYGLGALRPGEHVVVDRADGSVADFTIYAVRVYDKDNFPASMVYRDEPDAELRVVTCGGLYSKRYGYSSNTVLFARLTGETLAPTTRHAAHATTTPMHVARTL
jgi:hypothetical protein